jgi:hypothetical protein
LRSVGDRHALDELNLARIGRNAHLNVSTAAQGNDAWREGWAAYRYCWSCAGWHCETSCEGVEVDVARDGTWRTG